MNPSVKVKVLLLFVVGGIVLFVGINTFLNDEEPASELTISDDEYTITEPIVENSITEPSVNELAEVDSEETVEELNDVDYESFYSQHFGEEAVLLVKQLSEQVVKAWVEYNTNMDMWESISTPTFLEKVQKDLFEPRDLVTSVVKNQSVELTHSEDEGSVQTIVIVTRDILSNGQVVGERSTIYSVSFVYHENKWLVNELTER